MKKYLIEIASLFLLFTITVNAETCPLEKKVQINNEAGLVTATSEPYAYEYMDMIEDTGEVVTNTAYLGSINVYNLTENLYAVISNGKAKKTITYDDATDGVNKVSTGEMNMLKTYTISIYPTNKRCDTSAIRELQVTIPIENPYYKLQVCKDYPDYFYCSQFLNIENISRDDFTNGIEEYISQKQKEEEENRHEGVIDSTKSFIKKNWLIITIILVIIIAGIITYIIIRNKKRKEEIV